MADASTSIILPATGLLLKEARVTIESPVSNVSNGRVARPGVLAYLQKMSTRRKAYKLKGLTISTNRLYQCPTQCPERALLFCFS